MKLYYLIIALIFSSGIYAQTNNPEFDYEIIRTEIIYEHNADTTLTKLYNRNKELLNGKYQITHEDGLKIYVNFKKGLWDGPYKAYYKTGELNSIIHFKNGIKKDTGIWYYKNGNKKRELPYKNRQQHGICKWYYENGNLKTLITYKSGIKNGLCERYKSNGDLIDQIYFLKDKRVPKRKFEKSE